MLQRKEDNNTQRWMRRKEKDIQTKRERENDPVKERQSKRESWRDRQFVNVFERKSDI
jgi:hypothetical protein